jgi:hypothetical protein
MLIIELCWIPSFIKKQEHTVLRRARHPCKCMDQPHTTFLELSILFAPFSQRVLPLRRLSFVESCLRLI